MARPRGRLRQVFVDPSGGVGLLVRFYELETSRPLLIPLAFGLQAPVFYFTIMLTEQLRRSRASTSASPAADPVPSPALRSLLVAPADYGVLCWTFVLLPFDTAFAWIYAALMAANVVFLLGALPRWFQELRAIEGIDR